MMPGINNPVVEILLATYNGQPFLREQIDSILAQTYTPLRILARDDNSTDGTRAILENYATSHPDRFTLLPASDSARSAKGNFLILLRQSTAPYIAFADQDDVWIPEKISLSMAALQRLESQQPSGTPALVFTDLTVVDDRLQTLHPSFWAHSNINPAAVHHLRRLIGGNVVTGCTAVVNRPLAQLATRMPPEAFMHDWWLALLAASLGAATFLPTKTVLYRQHNANVLGAPEQVRLNAIPKWRRHDQRRIRWEISQAQAEALLQTHRADLPPKQQALLRAYRLCETSRSRLVRAWTFLRNRFFLNSLRVNLATLWYLWDMDFARNQDLR